MEEKDLKEKLPEEPSYDELLRLQRKKHDEEYNKLTPELREIADLADDLSEYHGFDKKK